VSKSLVLTVIGKDRPGIVNRLSDVAQRFGANWAGSRMAGLAGQFAGIVHFQVPDEKLEALATALRALGSTDLVVVIAEGDAGAVPTPHRMVRLELVGNDRPGIVRDLSGCLAGRGVSIEELHTEFVSAPMSADPLFKVNALLAVPAGLADAELKRELETLATEMMVDFELEARANHGPPI
jgi:glycine cleavage system regulatory protein